MWTGVLVVHMAYTARNRPTGTRGDYVIPDRLHKDTAAHSCIITASSGLKLKYAM